MASAKRVSAIPVPPPPDEIVLILSLGEAETLRLVLNCVAGSLSGRRGDASRISDALAEADVPWDYLKGPQGRLDFS